MSAPGAMTQWGLLRAFVLGLLGTMHPCALATSAAALSLVCAWGGGVRRNLMRGLLFAAGMCGTYTAAAASLAYGALSSPGAAGRLPGIVRPLLAPLVLIAGILLTGAFRNPGGPGPLRR